MLANSWLANCPVCRVHLKIGVVTELKLGARQRCIAADTLLEKMKILSDHKFDFLELALTEAEIQALNDESHQIYEEWMSASGLSILSTSMGHFQDFGAKSPSERRGIIEDIRRLIPFTKTIGADTILLAVSEDSSDVSEYIDVYRNELSDVADEALRAGVSFAFEHIKAYKPQILAKLVRGIDHPAIGIYFDMGNCLHVGEDPVAAALICAPYTTQLHIKGGSTTPIGAMPLAKIREILECHGYSGRACLEIPSMSHNRQLPEAWALLRMAGY